jgi:hypothetical protein
MSTRRIDGIRSWTAREYPSEMPPNTREAQSVVSWRRAQLIHAGVPRSLAARVARDERYDLHALLELVDNGCAPALAVRILEPAEQDAPESPSL